MRSIAIAMTWEHLKRNAWLMLMATLGPWAILALPLGGLLLNPDIVSHRAFAFVMFMFALVGFTLVALRQYDSRQDRLGFPMALYIRPISTAYMVAVRMTLDIATAIGLYVGLSLLVWAVSGVTLPLAIPIVYLAVIAAWTEAILWSLGGSALLLSVIGLGIEYMLFLWLCIGLLVEDPDTPIEDLTWRILSAIPLTALAYAVAVIGVRFDRRGDRLRLARLAEWIGDRIHAMRRADREFRSARAAQFWLEWHRKGQLLPILNLLALAIYAGLAMLTKEISLADGLAFLWGLGLVNVVFFPILVAMLVNTKERGASQDLFWATRPVTDNMLLLVRLRVAIASLLASWGLWLAGAIVISGLLWATGQPEGLITDIRNTTSGELFGFGRKLPLLITVPILGVWTILGIVGSLHVTGRRFVAALWMVPLWVCPLAWVILVGQGLIAPNADLIRSAWLCMGILCLVGTGLAYWAALRKGRISRWLGLTVLGAYLVACYATYPYPDGWAQIWSIHRAGLMALPLVPLALGPLAIAWNRHR